MRNSDNIEALSKLPIDYMGLIFYEKSPRFVSQTFEILNNSTTIKKVGVFVKANIDFIFEKILKYDLDAIQIHWDTPPQYLTDLRAHLKHNKRENVAIWKAFSIDETFDFTKTQAYEGIADTFLFDTKSPQGGGAGVKFDWSVLHQYAGTTPFLLAGGISENDAEAIRTIQIPTFLGVDLNSRFEIEPAMKDIQKLKKFIQDLENGNS